ncbi:hypothetical protein RHSP_33114 [Rhizobium freirei PRF 81]|uniref:Uncharacterized protein n=1 Tax=Rhizobium freirei PRF 81 TaxID=363754 RepID=N6UZJ1_9HYPH|nr:hypothetical protein RHSP_33114 [Rhizobium freirei PRF 81]
MGLGIDPDYPACLGDHGTIVERIAPLFEKTDDRSRLPGGEAADKGVQPDIVERKRAALGCGLVIAMPLQVTFGKKGEIDALRFGPGQIVRQDLGRLLDGIEKCQTLKSRDPHAAELA